MPDEQSRGRFVWFDLLTSDPIVPKAFYPSVTGWATEAWNGGTSDYTMWTAHGSPIGGVTKVSSTRQPPHWLAYIATPDVDETATQAENLGARILAPPTDVPSVGSYTVLMDPQGAAFAAFTPFDEPPGHEGDPRIGEFSWHELATHDYPAAFRFYERLFGWEKSEAIDMGGGNIYQMFSRRGRRLGGMYNRPADSSGPPAWLHYVRVEDINRAAATVTANGGEVVRPPHEVPGGDRIVECRDPLGARFALHQRLRV